MQGRFFATFGSSQLEEFEIPGGPLAVMLVSEIGQTESEFRATLGPGTIFDNKYCTTYPLERAHDMRTQFNMREYTMEELLNRRLD